MTPVNLDAAAAVVLSWLLTYAIHSTILLAVAAVAAWRFADQHAWLDLIWKTAVIAPLVTASLHLDPIALPLGGRWAMPSVTTVTGSPIVAPDERAASSAETDVTPAMTAERVTSSPVDRSRRSERCGSPVGRGPIHVVAVDASLVAVDRRSGVADHRHRRCGAVRRSTAKCLSGARLRRARDGHRSARHRRGVATQRESAPLDPADDEPAFARCPSRLAGRHIVLPERFLRELDPEQQRAALAHEMAHVVRRDPEWRIAIEILERALFFQPLNRLARARLCDAAEFLCDEWAVQQTQSPLALARCLSVVASWWSPADELPAGVSAMARSDSAMVRRVTRILNEPARIARRPRLHWLAIPVTLVAVAAPRVTATQLPTPVDGDAGRGSRRQRRERSRKPRSSARRSANGPPPTSPPRGRSFASIDPLVLATLSRSAGARRWRTPPDRASPISGSSTPSTRRRTPMT